VNKVNCFFWLMLVTAVAVGIQSLAAEVAVSVDISKNSVQVAEPFTVETRVTAPAGTHVNFPEVPPTFGELEVVDSQDAFDIPDPHDPALRTWTRQVTLESLVAGEHAIPSQEIQTEHDSEKEVLRTRQQQVEVVSVLENQVDPLSFRDIKTTVDVEVPRERSYAWVAWLAAGVATLGACTAAVALVATRKKWTTPRQWAVGELDRLQQACATETLGTKAVFTRLETIVKTYLEVQFSIPATQQTTHQLLEELALVDGTSDLTDKLADLLEAAKQARYAGWELDSRELQQATCDARELIIALDHSSNLALAHSTATPEKREEP
jgi:hypothetical protein